MGAGRLQALYSRPGSLSVPTRRRNSPTTFAAQRRPGYRTCKGGTQSTLAACLPGCLSSSLAVHSGSVWLDQLRRTRQATKPERARESPVVGPHHWAVRASASSKSLVTFLVSLYFYGGVRSPLSPQSARPFATRKQPNPSVPSPPLPVAPTSKSTVLKPRDASAQAAAAPIMNFSHQYYGGAQPYSFIGIPPLTPSHSHSAGSDEFNNTNSNQSPPVRVPPRASYVWCRRRVADPHRSQA